MTNQDGPNTENNDMRAMWIGTAVIVLLLLGGMGINMLIHHDTDTGSTEMSSQSRTMPPK